MTKGFQSLHNIRSNVTIITSSANDQSQYKLDCLLMLRIKLSLSQHGTYILDTISIQQLCRQTTSHLWSCSVLLFIPVSIYFLTLFHSEELHNSLFSFLCYQNLTFYLKVQNVIVLVVCTHVQTTKTITFCTYMH